MHTRNPLRGARVFCAAVLLTAGSAQAVPVNFTLDETLSSIALTIFSGSSTSNTEVLHLAGDFTLDLDPAAPGNWDGTAAVTDMLAGSYDGPVTLSIPGLSLQVDSLGLAGIDMTIPTIPASLTGGPGISTGVQSGLGVLYEVQGYAYSFLGNGSVDYFDTAVSDWTLQVADTPLLGVDGPGNVEAVLTTTFTSLVPPTTSLYITAEVTLAGTATVTPVPLPAALWLAITGLAGLFAPFVRRS